MVTPKSANDMTIEITAPSVVTHFKQPRGRKHIWSLDSYFL